MICDYIFRFEISFYDLNLFIYMIYDCLHDLKIILSSKTYFSCKEFRSENLDLRYEINIYA